VTDGGNQAWLDLAVEADHEAAEAIGELFARFGYQEGVVIEEPFLQDGDGDNLRVDPSRPVTVRTFVAAADFDQEKLREIQRGLWLLGKLRHVGELVVTERAEEDWANAWKTHYQPLMASERILIRPPWIDYLPKGDEIVVVLDPGMAFGSGTHPSTRLALMGLEAALKPGDTVMDVGTGSGILAIAAAKLGASRIDAVDIEPVSVRSARENAERNEVAAQIQVELGTAGTPFSGQYDVVVANIISRVLIELARDISAAVRPGGTLVLAGVIEEHEANVRETFEPFGFHLSQRRQIEDWVGLQYALPA
jgi:ribosomal protein L11 methyltransferase